MRWTSLLAATGAACALVAASSSSGASPGEPDPAARAALATLARTAASERAAVAYSRAFYDPTTTMQQRLAALAPNYVEHGPPFARFDELNHVQGREGFRLLLETLSRLRGGGSPIGAAAGSARSRRPAGNVLFQVVAQGDRVIVLNQQYQPDPQHPGKFYPVLVFDAFRIDDQGRIAEHWDYTSIPAKPPIFLREPASKIHFPKARLPIYGVAEAASTGSTISRQ